MAPASASGSVRLLFFYDVSDEIRLDEVRARLGAAEPGPALRRAAPEYVRFGEPPATFSLEPVTLAEELRAQARLSFYRYGVAGLELELPFSFGWDQLVQLSSRWVASPEAEALARNIVRERMQAVADALDNPYADWLAEDYCVVHVTQQPGMTAAELLAAHRSDIARIVRGEAAALAPEEEAEILQARLSYYPNDLLVVGWSAAFVCDNAEGASATVELLKYANTQLLDFRHYDEMLTRVLATVHLRLEGRRGLIGRWRLGRDAERLNTLLLDVRDLTERMDNSVKFLSDMFDARLYRLAAARVGVPDYRRLVDDKLRTASEMYRFMVDQFQHGRAFLLELTVVIILIIDLVVLFRGKH